ncbi:MAG: trypsin-like peptidase domain-containing protein, partial [Clostridia bacterium]|nr:trypsin-like peptidase domain-containing protein [Clostridia bacterium]
MGTEEQKRAEEIAVPATEGVQPAENGQTETAAATSPLADDTQQEGVAIPADGSVPPVQQLPPVAAPGWRFGESASDAPPKEKKRKNGQLGFFAIFGAVFGVCVLLLVLVLCIGDGAFRVVRELQTERVVYVRQDDGTSGLLTPNEAAHKVSASTVTVSVVTETGTGIGSGFVYTADGYILTNHHVIASATAIQVVMADGTAHDATLVGSDEVGDVAVLKINAAG